MAGNQVEFNPVSRLTTGYIGQPGKRVFYLQAQKGSRIATLLIEKQQVEALAQGVEDFLKELYEKFPELPVASAAYTVEEMRLSVPLDPLFRIGQLGLGYDQENDLLVLVAQEIAVEGREPEDLSSARFFATRSQMLAFSRYGLSLVRQGRPVCGNCGQPIDPEGHFCPRSNGHKH